MKTICLASLFIFCFTILCILAPILAHGLQALTIDLFVTEPEAMGTQGGIGPILVSTLMMNAIMIALVLCLGIPAGLRLSQLKNSHSGQRFHSLCSVVLEILAATPSIVFGLFGNAFFVVYLNWGYSLFAGAATLSLMVMPLFIRIMEEAFVRAHEDYGAICTSLGLSELRATWQILLPAVRPAAAAALVLSWTRAVGETAALLMTAGYSTRWPESIFDSGRSLSVHIFDLSMNVPEGDAAAFTSAFVLLLLTLFFSLLSQLGMKVIFKWKPRTTL